MEQASQLIHKRSEEIKAFRAGDQTLLKEVLHPKNDGINLPFSLASAVLKKGENSLPHRLFGSETYYFIQGNGHMVVDGNRIEVQAGDTVFVPPGAEQYVVNEGADQLEFLCIVAPAWSEEEEEVL